MNNNECSYIATAMNRYNVGNETFIYACSHTILGNIDSKTSLFVDQYGNIYGPYLDKSLMQSDINTAYANFIGINDIDKIVEGDLSFQEKLAEYEKRTRDVIYYVSKIDEDTPFSIPISISKLADSTKRQWENGQNYIEECTETPLLDTSESSQEYEVEEEWEEAIKQGEMNPELVELVSSVIGGEYSIEEIKEIREDLNREYEDIESVLDTLNLQIEATETGQASVIMKESIAKEESPLVEESVEELIDVDDIFEKVTKTLIAQDEAALRVIIEIARKEMHAKKKKDAILLTGPTGVGKTELMNLVAKYLDRPFLKINSATLTIPGYTGKDIEEYLWDLYVKCGCNTEKAERAVIFFDEIDKKGSEKKSDVSGQGVLNLLLSFIEGGTYDACRDTKTSANKVKINTSNMIIFFGGAFSDVYKNLTPEKEMGFNRKIDKTPKAAQTSDFVEKGLMTDEFMGRVAVVELRNLNVEDLKRVMLESDESAIKIQEKIFAKLGVKITFTDSYLNAIAKNAIKRKTGARGLNSIIDESTWHAFYQVCKKTNKGIYSEVILDEETIKNPTQYQLIKKA